MLAKDRRNEIIKKMKSNGGMIQMTEIISQFGVSHETARRDLEALQDNNFVRRIHGGALLNSKPGSIDFSIATDLDDIGADTRSLIGKTAASLINEGETVLLANGTTVLEVAKNLKKLKNLTVITNSLPVANELIDTSIEIFIIGGKVDNNELNMSGQLGVQAVRSIYADKAIIGAGGVSIEYGISDYSINDFTLREEIVKHARTTFLVCHSEKFGSNAFSVGLDLKTINTIITDKGLKPEYKAALMDMGITVITV